MKKRLALVCLFSLPLALSALAQKDQTITFPLIGLHIYGDSPFDLKASASSGLPITYSLSNSAVGIIAGDQFYVSGTGEVEIIANQNGNGEFNAAAPVTQRLFIQKAEQAIIFGDLEVATYGAGSYYLSAFATSFLQPTYTSSDSSIARVAGSALQILRAGEVQITATQTGDAHYFPAVSVTQTLTIKKKEQYIGTSPLTRTFGDPPFGIAAINSGLNPTWVRSQYDSIVSVTGNPSIGYTYAIRGAGSTMITIYQEGNENYLPGQGSFLITVNKAPQTISFDALPPQSLGNLRIPLTATSSSGLPLSLISTSPGTATVQNNVVILHSPGTTDIVAKQTGNANYLPATPVTRSLVINGTAQIYPVTGITRRGGNGRGTVFTLNTDGTGMSTTHLMPYTSFDSPNGGLIKGSDGKLYGADTRGGTPANGVVFSINSDGTGYTVLHNFNNSDGAQPSGSLLELPNGYLVGVTQWGGLNVGVIYRVEKDGSNFSVLYAFNDPYYPNGGLMLGADGRLYGTAYQGGNSSYGTLYAINSDGTGFMNIVDFDRFGKGSSPRGVPVQGTDLYLYGVTGGGGANDKGVLYKVKTDGTNYTALKNFDGITGSYGSGKVIIASDGKLYGMTQNGGANDLGTIYSATTNGSSFTKLFDFGGTASGAVPLGSLTEGADGYLYGMTSQGGSTNLGVVFKIKKDGSGFTKLLDFAGNNGSGPQFGPLLETAPGLFCGMTYLGGPSDDGSIFSISASGSYTLLKDFPQPASWPNGFVSNDNSNKLVGLSSVGGSHGGGALFTVDPDGSNFSDWIDLAGGDYPLPSRLMIASDGNAWGLVQEGVSINTTSIFRVTPTGNYQRIAMQDPAIGIYPTGLVENSDGYLYGAAGTAGNGDHGTVFRIRLDGSGIEHVADIPGITYGARPYSALIKHSNGAFYGTTAGGAMDDAMIYRVRPGHGYSKVASLGGDDAVVIFMELKGGSLLVARPSSLTIYDVAGQIHSTIFTFSNDTGQYPQAIMQTVEGQLIVALRDGGTFGDGTIIKLWPDGSGYQKVFDFNGTNGAEPDGLLMKKQDQEITSFDNIPQKEFLDPPFILSATTSSGAEVTFTSSDTTVAVMDGYVVHIKGAGTATIHAKILSNANFRESSEVVRSLTVIKSDPQFTFGPLTPFHFGDNDFRLIAGRRSGNPVTFVSDNPAVATIQKGVVNLKAAGTATITASLPPSPNFVSVTPIQQLLTVEKKDQHIQFATPGTLYTDAGTYVLDGTNPDGILITYSTSNSAVASIADSLVTITGPGKTTITASAAGDNNHNPATVSHSFNVVKHQQIIVFDQISNHVATDSSFGYFPPRSTAGLNVDLSVLSSNVTISQLTITIGAAGKAKLEATQPGNENVNAAGVSQEFCIKPVKPTITIDSANIDLPVLKSSSTSGNQWLFDGSVLAEATNQSLEPDHNGTYGLIVTVDGCSSDAATVVVGLVTGVHDERSEISCYPNPATTTLNVQLSNSSTNIEIVVVDLVGREVQSVHTSQPIVELDVRNLSKGLYLLKVNIGGKMAIKRFVKS